MLKEEEVVEDIKLKLLRKERRRRRHKQNNRSRKRDRRRHKTIEKGETNRIWIHIQ